MKTKKLFSLLALMFIPGLAAASPITVDSISAPQGLTITVQNAAITVPSTSGASGSLVTSNSTESLKNKTFDQTSNVVKQFRGVYDFAVNGGATGVDIDLGAMPANSIIIAGKMYITTAPVTLYNSPLLSFSALNGNNDLLNQTVPAALPVGYYSTKQQAGTSIISSPTHVVMHLTGGSISAGQIQVLLDYLTSQ